MPAVLIPLQWVRVTGPSMAPTLQHGDWVLAWVGAPIHPGDVVLARFDDLGDRVVIKRAARPDGTGWWVRSDNAFAGGDSETHGAAAVHARALLRWRGRNPIPRRLSRRGSGSA